MKILCDLDGICADIYPDWLDTYNKEYKDKISVSDLTTYHLEDHVKPEAIQGIYEILKRPGFFLNLKPLPGAIETLYQLQSEGHDICIATAVMHPEGAADKFAWVLKHLPFVNIHNLFITWRKELIKSDILIDDSPTFIKAYRRAHRKSHIITISYPYNKDVVKLVNLRAKDYKDTTAGWHQMLKYIRKVSK